MKIDNLWGDAFYPHHFEENEGQGPWTLEDYNQCRRCKTPWIPAPGATDITDFVLISRTEYLIAMECYEKHKGTAARQMKHVCSVADLLFNKMQHTPLTELEQGIYDLLHASINYEAELIQEERKRLEEERT